MNCVSSFSVNHDTLEKGMYISRIDGDIVPPACAAANLPILWFISVPWAAVQVFIFYYETR